VLAWEGYFTIDALPVGATVALVNVVKAGGNNLTFQVTTGGVLQCNYGTVSGPTLVANRLYALAFEIDATTGTNTVRWRTWDSSTGVWTTRTNGSLGLSESFNISNWSVAAGGATSVLNARWVDIWSAPGTTPGADYATSGAFGSEQVVLRPTSDGSHSFTAGDFGYGTAGGDVATNATDTNTYVGKTDLSVITNPLRQKVARSTAYLEWLMSDLPETGSKVIKGVGFTMTFHASGTTADQISIQVSDDNWAHTTSLLTNEDVSDTTVVVRHVFLSAPPSGGSWTAAKVNSLKMRGGFSNNIASVPYMDGIAATVLLGYNNVTLTPTAVAALAKAPTINWAYGLHPDPVVAHARPGTPAVSVGIPPPTGAPGARMRRFGSHRSTGRFH
jgi:hypothetical protein